MLKPSLLDEYNLSTWPYRQLRTPEEVLDSPERGGRKLHPTSVKLNWFGDPTEVGIRLAKEHTLNGMVGTKLLKRSRLTVDVVEGGDGYSHERIPSPPKERLPGGGLSETGISGLKHKAWKIKKTVQKQVIRYDQLFPWAILDVRDSKGRLQPVCFNVDTGG